MKVFYKGKLINAVGQCKTLKGKTSSRRLVAQYKFDKSIYDNLIPEFNVEFTNYEIVDEYLDAEDIVTTTTETMMIMDYDAEPDEYGVLTTEYEVENVSTFSAENIVTRSIYSIELPTMVRFGYPHEDNIYTKKQEALLQILYLNTDRITTMATLFRYCINLIDINSSNWNTVNVTDMSDMFRDCSSLASIDVSNWNTGNVTDMRYMFYNCTNLTSLDLSKWDTSNVTDMGNMFHSCKSLTSLDLSNWDVSNVNTMIYMFRNCQLLKSLDVSNWDVSNVTDMYQMFCMCYDLVCLNMSGWIIDNTYIHSILDATNSLMIVLMKNTNYTSVNKIISYLPNRSTADNPGVLNITGIDNINQVNISAAEVKYWNIINEENTYFVLGKSKLGQDKLK